ncbi:unnamed protein product [Leptosia nina]|uniref:FLYWCH-type domain-containing protein n=1 Tax=Leptosia nina TaxID=320188 RepID=A0AAV1J5S4_9NEOP
MARGIIEKEFAGTRSCGDARRGTWVAEAELRRRIGYHTSGFLFISMKDVVFVFAVRFCKRDSGKELAIVKDFTFCRQRRGQTSDTWICSRGYACKARFSFDVQNNYIRNGLLDHNHPPIFFAKRKTGKDVAIVNHYSFYRKRESSTGVTWICTRGNPCKARFFLRFGERKIKRGVLEHHHAPNQYIIKKGYLPLEYELVPRGSSYVLRLGKHTFSTNYANAAVEYVTSQKGKTLLKMNGYTYSLKSDTKCRKKNRWVCSTHQVKRCPGVLLITDGKIVSRNENHNHPPKLKELLPFLYGPPAWYKQAHFMEPTGSVTQNRDGNSGKP